MSTVDTWFGNDWGQTDTRLEWVELTPEQCERADAFSRSGDRPWRLYQQALALLGFATWLHQRAPDIDCPIEPLLSDGPGADRSSTPLNKSSAPWIEGTVTISVGDFQVCLLPGPSLSDDQVAVPSGVIEPSQEGCHFYVWVTVNLELKQVAVRSFQTYGALCQACILSPPDSDSIYWIDEAVFDPNPDQLLLQLKCLAPEAIPLALPIETAVESAETPVSSASIPISVTPSSIERSPTTPLEDASEAQIPWGIQLSSWVQGPIDAGWQTLEAIFGSATLQYEWRMAADSAVVPIVRGKVIDTLLCPSGETIVLLVEVLPSAEPSATDLNITLKVSSADGQRFLPARLELVVLDEVGEAIMHVQARDESRMLELGFYAARGDRFSVRLKLHDRIVDEYFTV